MSLHTADHEVVDLHAYDPQETLVDYSLDTDGPFDIDPDLGRIFVNDTLDREVSLWPQLGKLAIASYYTLCRWWIRICLLLR